jgi:hypothetical protein
MQKTTQLSCCVNNSLELDEFFSPDFRLERVIASQQTTAAIARRLTVE